MNKDDDISPVSARRNLLTGIGAGLAGVVAWRQFGSGTAQSVERSPGALPEVTLLTHEGKTVHFYDDLVRNKVVAVNMMYTRCEGICPGATLNLQQVKKLLGQRVQQSVHFYTLSLDPEFDTTERLRDYMRLHRIGDTSTYLTGERSAIEAVRYWLGFYDPDPLIDQSRSNHTGMLRIGNDRVQRWMMSPAMAEAEQIVATIDHVDDAVRLRNSSVVGPDRHT